MTKNNCATTVTRVKPGCLRAWRRVGGRCQWSILLFWSSLLLHMWLLVLHLGTIRGLIMMNLMVLQGWRSHDPLGYISSVFCSCLDFKWFLFIWWWNVVTFGYVFKFMFFGGWIRVDMVDLFLVWRKVLKSKGGLRFYWRSCNLEYD